MTTKIIFASNKLAGITNAQLQQMLNRFHLGKLIASNATEKGAMGQTMFVSSSKGDFVLKGNPLYPGQLIEEKYFVENIHKRTNVAVPLPFIIDESKDIFGWSYALMPRLAGEHMNTKQFVERDKLKIASLLAETLTEFHNWKEDQFGELNPEKLTVKSFQDTYTDWLCNRIRYWLDDAKKYSIITREDIAWVEMMVENSKGAFEKLSSPTFVMGDFKPGNFLLASDANGWKISGVFDFTNAYFGDPLSDLIKMLTIYIDKGELDVAKYFLSAYLNGKEDFFGGKEAIKQRINVHMLQQRTLDWGCAKAIGMVGWDNNLSFSSWAARYTAITTSLLD